MCHIKIENSLPRKFVLNWTTTVIDKNDNERKIKKKGEREKKRRGEKEKMKEKRSGSISN